MGKKTQPNNMDALTSAQAFKILSNGNDELDEQAFSTFITETLQLPADSILQFYLMTTCMKTPKLGHIKFQNFANLFLYQGIFKTVKDLKKNLPKFEKDLNDPKIFKTMYNNVFEAFLIKNLSMEFEFAEMLWSVLLAKTFNFHKEFAMYLDHLGPKKPLKCHKDLWQMMYDFSVTVKSIKKDYKQSDGWPVFLDNFVQFLKEKGLDN